MLLQDRPGLIICFHDHFDPASGGTSDTALRGLLRHIPVWLVLGEDPAVGRWLSLDLFPQRRAGQVRRQLDAAAPLYLNGLRSRLSALVKPVTWRRSGDDGQLNLPSGGPAELPGGGQRDYFVRLLSMAEART